jgi:uncharacterized protein YkwD
MTHYTRRVALALLATSLLSACASTIPPLPAKVSDRPEDLTRDQIVATVNAVRRANGAGSWRYNPQKDTLSHDLGVTLRQRVSEAGYLLAVGENVAKGYKTLPDAIEGWLGSQGHRNTLLSNRFAEFGLAFARTNSGKLYWALIAGGPYEAWVQA